MASLVEAVWEHELMPGERVGFYIDKSRRACIEVIGGEDGTVEVRCSDGQLVVEPRVTNEVSIRATMRL